MSHEKNTPVIHFKAAVSRIRSWMIVRLPEDASLQLSSRGQVMVNGTVNGVSFQAPLEPDGKWGHWLRITKALHDKLGIGVGDVATFSIKPTKDWPEPHVPADLKTALENDPEARKLFEDVTPMARWEWVRWIRATEKEETRKRRIEVGLSKLKHGERRPCCWNRNSCTEPYVSKKGVLLESTEG
jgi:hypothetical protein